jgi:hypothetical protein
MTAIAGSIAELSIDGRIFSVAGDSDGERDLGGMTSEHQPNGDRSARLLQTAKVWMFGGVNVSVDDDEGAQEYLQAVQDAGVNVPIKIQMASGIRYQGQGCVTGDLKYSSASGTCTVQLSGPGKLEQQPS